MATDEQVSRNVLTRIVYKINHKELLDKEESIIFIFIIISLSYKILNYLSKHKSTISSS